jgi:outer membrane protein assembly factor BamB
MKKLFAGSILTTCLVLMSRVVQSQVTTSEWFQDTQNGYKTGVAVVAHLNENDCDGIVVNAVGNTVYLRLATTGEIWGAYTTGGIIDNTPVLVKLQDGKWYVFVASEDGKLYKLDVANHGAIAATGGISQIVSIRRATDSSCSEKDKITAAPVVQLLAESNSSYTLGKDIVIVGTHHGCSSTTTNMVYAFDAAAIHQAPVWIFNEFGDYSVDYCNNLTLDVKRNAVFTTHNQTNVIQNSIWRLNTVTGNLDWAGNFNSIHSRPVMGNAGGGGIDHLYVGDVLGQIHGINPDNGIEDWNLDIIPTPGVFPLNLTIGEGDFAQVIMATSTDGIVHAIYDGGTGSGDAEVLWNYHHPSSTIKAITSVALMSDSGKCYVGFDDGTVHQLNIATGSDEVYLAPFGGSGPAGSYIYAEPGIYKDGLNFKLIESRSFWDNSGGTIFQNAIPGFVYNNPSQSVWIGSISSAWENAGNWSPNGVPDATKNVLINPCLGIQFPNHNIVTVSSNAVCRSIDIRPGVTVTIAPGFKLNVVH